MKTVHSSMLMSVALMVVTCLTAIAVLGTATSVLAEVSSSEVHEGFLHELSADKAVYVMYEDVAIDYSVTNESGSPVWMYFPCSSVAIWIRVLDANGEWLWCLPAGCMDAFWDDTLDPGESYERSGEWDMIDHSNWWPITEPGVYTVQGILDAYQDPHAHIISLEITILDEATTVPETAEHTWSLIKALYR